VVRVVKILLLLAAIAAAQITVGQKPGTSTGGTTTTVTGTAPIVATGTTAVTVSADTSTGATKLATQGFVTRQNYGDITAVTAGSGLTGGGASGAVTLTVSGVGNTNIASDANIAGSKLADAGITFAKLATAVQDSIWKMRPATVIVAAYNSLNKKADFVCDGVNDEATIYAAQHSLPDSGGTVLLRQGTYAIHDTVRLDKSFVRFVGEGMWATRIIGKATNQCMFVAPTGTDWYLPNNISFVQFENIYFESSATGQKAILFKEMNNYLGVKNCYFKKFEYGLWLYGTYASNINGCRFQSCIRAICAESTHDLMISNCKDYGWEQDGGQTVPSYFFYGNGDVNLQLSFCSVEHAMPGSAAVHLNREFAATVTLNEFEETGCGVRIVGNMVIPTADTLASALLVGNTFRGLDSSVVLKNTSRVSVGQNIFDRGTGVGVAIIGTCNKLKVNNNYFFKYSGTDIYATGAVCNQCAIANNNLSDTNDLYFSGGNYGFGTSSPKEDVHIYGNHPELRLTHSTYAGGAGVGGMIRWTNYNVAGTIPNNLEFNLAGIKGYDRDSFWGGALGLFTAPNGTVGGSSLVERITILPDGKIGLGTTNPTYAVAIGGQTNFKGSTFTDGGFAHVVTVDNSYGTWCGGTGAGANAYLRIFGNAHATNPGEIQFVYGGDLGTTAPNSAVKFNFLNGSGAASTKAKVDSSGNAWVLGSLGIATTAPGSKLSVAGGVAIGTTYAAAAAPAEGLLVQGNVGIGTTNPSTALSVYGQITTGTTAPWTLPAAIGTTEQYLRGDGNWGTVTAGISGSGTSGFLPKFSAATTVANSNVYDDGTKIGIATTAPSARLHTVGTGTTNTSLAFLANNSTGVIGLAVDDRGYVGVGKSNPAFALEVSGNEVMLPPTIYRFATGSVWNSDRLQDLSGNFGLSAEDDAIITADHNNDDVTSSIIFAFDSPSTPTEKMRLTSTGSLGIGTTAPGLWELYVNGDAFVDDTLSAGTLVDRTPWYEGDALAALKPVTGKNGKIDHATLPASLQASIKVNRVKDKNTGELMPEKFIPAIKDSLKYETVQNKETGRDVGATISMLIKAVQQLQDSLKTKANKK
jgi:hypothetical protein